MGIINNHRKQKRRAGTYTEPIKKDTEKVNSKILDLTYMKKMIDNVMNHHMTGESKSSIKGHRTWVYVQKFRLQNLLGRVDTPTFVYMMESMLEWCVDCRAAVQPNGKWELLNYEQAVEVIETHRNQTVGKDQDGRVQTIELAEDVQYLVIGMEFVDINGNSDLQYDMGRVKAGAEASLTPKMLKELLESQGSRQVQPVPDPELGKYKDKLKVQQEKIAQQDASLLEMREQMTTMQDMMAGLITELQTARNSAIVDDEKPKPKKRGK